MAIGTEKWLFEPSSGGGGGPTPDGSVTLSGTTSLDNGGMVKSIGTTPIGTTGNITVDTTGNIYGTIKAGGNIQVDSVGNLGDATTPVTLYAGGNIVISNKMVVCGDLIAVGNITIPAGASVTGNMVAGGSITLVGNTVTGTVIVGTDLILRKNGSTPCTISGSSVTGIAIIVYGAGNTNLYLYDNVAHIINGLVYVGSGTSANLTFGTAVDKNISRINGTVIVRNLLDMTNAAPASNITWNSSNFKDFTSYPDVFAGFSGGRRVYLPVPGSWKEE